MMDPWEAVAMDSGAWTEERHSNFLSWMEESFVRRMLAGDADLDLDRRPPPLDRCLPDSAVESTVDSHDRSRGRRSPATAAKREIEGSVGVTQERRRKRRLPPQYDEKSQDQVVPQLGTLEVNNGNTDENKREGNTGVSLSCKPPTTQRRRKRGCHQSFNAL